MKRKNKVLAYIYRENLGVREVLVFDHDEPRDDSFENPQVPAGTLQENETLGEGLLREIFEEAGLKFDKPTHYLGAFDYKREEIGEIHHRHVFEFQTEGLEESWTHVVSSNDEDNGMTFHYYWLPINVAKEKLVGSMGDYLPKVS